MPVADINRQAAAVSLTSRSECDITFKYAA